MATGEPVSQTSPSSAAQTSPSSAAPSRRVPPRGDVRACDRADGRETCPKLITWRLSVPGARQLGVLPGWLTSPPGGAPAAFRFPGSRARSGPGLGEPPSPAPASFRQRGEHVPGHVGAVPVAAAGIAFVETADRGFLARVQHRGVISHSARLPAAAATMPSGEYRSARPQAAAVEVCR